MSVKNGKAYISVKNGKVYMSEEWQGAHWTGDGIVYTRSEDVHSVHWV